jgi:hypothetical protein
MAGEGWGEGVPLELPPHLDPLPEGRGRFIFPLFVQTHMSILIRRRNTHFAESSLAPLFEEASEASSPGFPNGTAGSSHHHYTIL